MNKPPSHRRPGALQAPLTVVAALAAAAFLAAEARCRSPLTRQRIARGSCHA